MNGTNERENLTPPNFLAILRAGFDAATNHLYLILFPVAADLFLWLGPHFQMKTLLGEMYRQIQTNLANLPPDLAAQASLWTDPENAQMLKAAQTFVVERFNLMIFLRTFPVGIPSFMSGKYPIGSPLGSYPAIDISDPFQIFGLWMLVSALGLILGIFYYQVTAQATLNGKVDWIEALRRWPVQALNSLGLGVLLVGSILAAFVPFFCLALVSLGSLAMISFVLYSGLLLVIAYPFVFIGHAIAADNASLGQAVRSGFRLARMTMPMTSLFFLIVFLITRALEWLWAAPAEDSWLTLIAIAGHAFVTTGLLAATFLYYRSAGRWLQQVLRVLA